MFQWNNKQILIISYVVVIQHIQLNLDLVATKDFQVVWYQIYAMQPITCLKVGYFYWSLLKFCSAVLISYNTFLSPSGKDFFGSKERSQKWGFPSDQFEQFRKELAKQQLINCL